MDNNLKVTKNSLGEINFIFKDFIEPNLPGDEFVKKLENSFYS